MLFVFLRRSGRIWCEVIGNRRYSHDLPQGGLVIPCMIYWKGQQKDVSKVEKLIKFALRFSDSRNVFRKVTNNSMVFYHRYCIWIMNISHFWIAGKSLTLLAIPNILVDMITANHSFNTELHPLQIKCTWNHVCT